MKAKASCPYAKSDMTPCVLKDGEMCFAMDTADQPICVGCEKSPASLGVARPADWDMTVANYYATQKTRR